MNPPFRDARRQNVSPDPRRRSAHVGVPGLLDRWIATAAWLLKPRGVLTLIWRADELEAVTGGLRPAFGEIAVLPVLSKAKTAPIRVLVRAMKDGRGTQMEYPPLSLNDEHGRPTASAESVLRGGNTLTIAEI
jgi:tRNA1(Val) A37 N6-methylase TrmN6